MKDISNSMEESINVKLNSDGFDFDSFAVDKSAQMPIPYVRHILTVSVGKPNSQRWFKRKIGDGYEPRRAYILERKDEREIYLLNPNLLAEVAAGDIKLVDLFL